MQFRPMCCILNDSPVIVASAQGEYTMPTLDWIGKDKVLNRHQAVPYRVLERRYSYDDGGQHEAENSSGNMIIQQNKCGTLR